MDMRELFSEMMNNMPDELKAVLKDAVYSHVDAMVADPKKREMTRARVKDDPDSLKSFECACQMYDLNTQIVQSLGLIKQMLSGFDETNHSTARLESNMNLFKHISMLIGITIEGVRNQVGGSIGEENENRNGDSSGQGS